MEIIQVIEQPTQLQLSESVKTSGVSVEQLVKAFFESKSPSTLTAYSNDLHVFRKYLKFKTQKEAVANLLEKSHGAANLAVLNFRAFLIQQTWSPASINRALSAIRSLIELANTLGLVSFQLNVPSIKSRSYRDTKGCGQDGFKALLATAAAQRQKKAVRDTALLWMLYSPALRRAEVISLDLKHVDLKTSTVHVLGKGKTEREKLTMPVQAIEALKAWLQVRGDVPGPLFVNCDRAKKGNGRLTPDGLYKMVKALAAKCNIEARPHGLRHAGITSALDLSKGDVRAVAKFSRHADIRTLTRYDDNRTDLGGGIAQLVANSAALA